MNQIGPDELDLTTRALATEHEYHLLIEVERGCRFVSAKEPAIGYETREEDLLGQNTGVYLTIQDYIRQTHDVMDAASQENSDAYTLGCFTADILQAGELFRFRDTSLCRDSLALWARERVTDGRIERGSFRVPRKVAETLHDDDIRRAIQATGVLKRAQFVRALTDVWHKASRDGFDALHVAFNALKEARITREEFYRECESNRGGR